MAAWNPRANEIFVGALEKSSPETRAAYLDDVCAGDDALRRQVDALLAAHVQAGSFLDRPAAGPAQPETVSAGTAAEAIGTILAGKYKLIEAIGGGGMGNVYMAQQTEPVKRLVAVKVIKAGMDSRSVLARFDAERQALAMMDHPNIAKVYDAGTTDGSGGRQTSDSPTDRSGSRQTFGPGGTLASSATDGQPYFVMELVKGVPITKFCDDRKLTPRERLELFVQVCQAIQHAHQKGVIHRDIKPSNVLVAMYDDRPVPKVIDFGVAKATGSQLTDHTLVTNFGAVVGTPEYMSPEQASFNQMDVDTRSDVYSLGVLLYELLTGVTPVDRKSLGQAAVLEILRIVREVEPPRPSDQLSTSSALPSIAALRQTEPSKLTLLLRGELDWVVMKALEKDRTRRYDTANALARDVQRYLADDFVEARPPSAGYRLRKFVRRHKGQVIAASVVLLALVGGIVGTTWGLVEANDATRLARAEQDRTLGEKIRADDAANGWKKAADDLEIERERLAAEKKKLEDEQDLTRRLLYASRINLAGAALVDNRWDRLRKLLKETKPKPGEANLRGWEWHFLDNQDRLPVLSEFRVGKDDEVFHVTPDGRWVLSSSKGDGWRDIDVWEVKTGTRMGRIAKVARLESMPDYEFTGHAFLSFGAPVVSPDGRYLATWKPVPQWKDHFFTPFREDIRLWHVATGKEVPLPANAVNGYRGDLVIGPDAAWLAWTERRALSPLPAWGASAIGLMSAPFGDGRITGLNILFRGKVGLSYPRNEPIYAAFYSAWEVTVARWEKGKGVTRKSFSTTAENTRLSADGQTAFSIPTNRFHTNPLYWMAGAYHALDMQLQNVLDMHLECWDLTTEKPKLRWPAIPLNDQRAMFINGPLIPRLRMAILSPGQTMAVVIFDMEKDDHELKVFRLADGRLVWRTLYNKSHPAIRANISDDGKRVVLDEGIQIKVFEEPLTPEPKSAASGEASPARQLVLQTRGSFLAQRGGLSADGGALVVHDPDGEYDIMDVGGVYFSSPPHFQGPSDIRVVRVLDISRDHKVVDSAPGVRSGILAPDRRLVHVQKPRVNGKPTSLASLTEWSLYKVDGAILREKIAGGGGYAAPTPDGSRLLVKSDKGIDIYNAMTGEFVSIGPPDGMAILTPGRDSLLGLGKTWWTTLAGDRLAVVTWPIPETVTRPNMAPGYERFNRDPLPLTLRIYDTGTGQELWHHHYLTMPANSVQVIPGDTISDPRGIPPTVLFSPDGRRMYLSYPVEKVKRILVLEMAKGMVQRTIDVPIPGNDKPTRLYGLAPDGRLVIVRYDQVQLWNPDTGNMDLDMPVHERLEDVCFSPDGARLFVFGHVFAGIGKQESRLSVWDLTTKRELLDLPIPGTSFNNPLPFRLDNGKLYIRGKDGIHVFDGTPTK